MTENEFRLKYMSTVGSTMSSVCPQLHTNNQEQIVQCDIHNNVAPPQHNDNLEGNGERSIEATMNTVVSVERNSFMADAGWSLHKILKGLGKVFTGYDLIFSLPSVNNLTFKSCVRSIKNNEAEAGTPPFENLEEEVAEVSNANVDATATVTSEEGNGSPCRVPFNFPIFIIFISFLEWLAFKYIMTDQLKTILEYHPFRRLQIWRFYTDTFIHGSSRHLWGNLKAQLIIGSCLEIVHGWKRVGFLYIIGVVFGNLSVSIFSPMKACFGASGAVFALVTGHLSSFALNWNEMSNPLVRTVAILAYLALQIYSTVFLAPKRFVPGRHYQVSYASHFGGALVGFIIGVNILKNFRRRERDIKLGRICHKIATIFFFSCIGANIAMQMFLEGFYTYKVTRNYVVSYELCKTIAYLPNNTSFNLTNYQPKLNSISAIEF